MLPQIRTQAVRFPTQLTDKRADIRMGRKVSLHMKTPAEATTANCTLVWKISPVGGQVVAETLSLGKCLPAVLAHVYFVFFVELHVIRKVGAVREDQTARFASDFDQTVVNKTFMVSSSGRLAERFPTYDASQVLVLHNRFTFSFAFSPSFQPERAKGEMEPKT